MAQHMELHKVRRDLEVLDRYPHPVKYQALNSSQGDEILGDESPEDELSEDNISASLDQKEALQLLRQSDETAQLSRSIMSSKKYREKIRASNESLKSISPSFCLVYCADVL